MQPADRGEFMRTLNGLAAIKGKDLTPEALDVWWSAMRAWALADFKAAASHLVTACQFMPTPYDFAQLNRAGELTAGEAWVRVLSGAPLEPDSRTARAARIVGGQTHVRAANIERDLPHIQRRFMDAYDELTDVDETRHALENTGLRRLAARQWLLEDKQ
jgi:hypothetical protein